MWWFGFFFKKKDETETSNEIPEEEEKYLERYKEEMKNEKLESNAFFQHLFTETAVVSSTHPCLIRDVLCMPDKDLLDTSVEEDSESSPETIILSKQKSKSYNRCSNGLSSTVTKIGLDRSPQMLSCDNTITNKRNEIK